MYVPVIALPAAQIGAPCTVFLCTQSVLQSADQMFVVILLHGRYQALIENYEYSVSFTTESEEDEDLDCCEDEKRCFMELLYEYRECQKNNLYFVLPFAPALFEKTVADCEQVAKEFSGKLKAKIDYSCFTATIDLWLCYVEFKRGEFMSTLHNISHCASSIRMTPLTNGDLHIEILMPYFVFSRGSLKYD